MRRGVRAYSRRVGDGDIEALASLVQFSDEVDLAIRAAVDQLRSVGYSWTDIGRVLGVSRQAVSERFGSRS
jgi:hypothetical protein